jgi:hypothetical protein
MCLFGLVCLRFSYGPLARLASFGVLLDWIFDCHKDKSKISKFSKEEQSEEEGEVGDEDERGEVFDG